MRLLLSATILLALATFVISANSRCSGQNEVYSKCHSSCPETCKNFKSGGTGCIALCREGCGCKSGFLRNSRGKCVPKHAC